MLLLSACSTTQPFEANTPNGIPISIAVDEKISTERVLFTNDFQNATVWGQGKYRYRLILQHPLNNHYAMPNQPYALSYLGDEIDFDFVKDEKKVFQGVTDEYGRTDVFAFSEPANPEKFFLRQRTGQGRFGEQYVINDQHGQPVVAFAYTLLVCNARPHTYSGVTDVRGNTAYAATKKSVNLVLLDRDDELIQNYQAQKELCAEKNAQSKIK